MNQNWFCLKPYIYIMCDVSPRDNVRLAEDSSRSTEEVIFASARGLGRSQFHLCNQITDMRLHYTAGLDIAEHGYGKFRIKLVYPISRVVVGISGGWGGVTLTHPYSCKQLLVSTTIVGAQTLHRVNVLFNTHPPETGKSLHEP